MSKFDSLVDMLPPVEVSGPVGNMGPCKIALIAPVAMLAVPILAVSRVSVSCAQPWLLPLLGLAPALLAPELLRSCCPLLWPLPLATIVTR